MVGLIQKYGWLIWWVLILTAYSASAEESDQENGIKGLSEDMAMVTSALDEIGITLGGVIEVEAAYTDDGREADDTSDITLATVELGVDVHPVRHVSGFVLFSYEEGDSQQVEIDEAFIRLDGEDKVPFFVQAGRQYLPFGYLETRLISDPPTLELSETRESSVIAGYAQGGLEITVGAFNGDVNKTGEEDDHIDDYVAGAVYSLPGERDFRLMVGLSYISNIGESDTLEGEDGIDVDAGGTIEDDVPGVAAFISANFKEKAFLDLAYVTATEAFESGELGFDAGRTAQPWAASLEVAYRVTDRLAAAIRYARADETGDFLPETQYGAAVHYAINDFLTLGLEYLYGEFDTAENEDIRTVLAQLAMEF